MESAARSQHNGMKLIATWEASQDITDEPMDIRWEDGTAATMEDFRRCNKGGGLGTF
jgi:hypothetical protein